MSPRRPNWLLIGTLCLMTVAQWASCRTGGTGKVPPASDRAKDIFNILSYFGIMIWGLGLILFEVVRSIVRHRRQKS